MATDASTQRTSRGRERLQSARGMIFIQIGLAIFVLTAFSAFIIDYSVIWLTRRQAQNAADAGALAGATARAFDEPVSAGSLTTAAASQTASANNVYGSAAVATVDASSPCPAFAAGGASDGCVQVNVYRDGTNGSTPIPTIVARMFGANTMGVAATATAQVRSGNSTACLKPWVMPDKSPAWSRSDIGSSITLSTDITKPTFYKQLDLNGGGESGFLANITGCAGISYSVTDFVTLFPVPNPNPAWQSDQLTAVQAVVSQDPSASPTPGGTVVNSCSPASCSCTGCANGFNSFLSPRIVTVALANPATFTPSSTAPVQIVNLLSILIQSQDATGNITGVIVPTTGLFVESEGTVSNANAFIAIPTLVR